MPTYEYECSSCMSRFDLVRKLGERDEPTKCPECGHEDNHKRPVTPAALYFKGAWYTTKKEY